MKSLIQSWKVKFDFYNHLLSLLCVGWSGVLGKLLVPGRPTDLDNSRPNALAVGADGSCLDVLFCLISHFSHLSPCRWEKA